MSELNFELLQQNIRELMKNNNITQKQLAEIAGMTQANVSKALNEKETKQFTIDQIYRISLHFGISIDKLVGNAVAQRSAISPRAMLSTMANLLSESAVKIKEIEVEEESFYPYFNGDGYFTYNVENITVKYPAFYFPSYGEIENPAENVENETEYKKLNEIIPKIVPVIKLYKEKEMPEEAYQMVLKGYLEKLSDK